MANATAEMKRAKAPGGTAFPAAGPHAAPPASVPRPGMFATVSNRHGVISSVDPRLHAIFTRRSGETSWMNHRLAEAFRAACGP